jgi:hypothetical protein
MKNNNYTSHVPAPPPQNTAWVLLSLLLLIAAFQSTGASIAATIITVALAAFLYGSYIGLSTAGGRSTPPLANSCCHPKRSAVVQRRATQCSHERQHISWFSRYAHRLCGLKFAIFITAVFVMYLYDIITHVAEHIGLPAAKIIDCLKYLGTIR